MRPRPELLALAALIALAALPGCGKRERLNPFDPANPVTGGRPPGFEALAQNSAVTLRWSATETSGLVGYQLYRRTERESTFTALGGLIPAGTTQRGDFGLQNGVDHFYRLYYVFAGGSGGLPAEDDATPGPLMPWVADYGRPGVELMTSDGHHILSTDTFVSGPSDVAADAVRDRLWISDPLSSHVIVVTPSSGQRVSISAVSDPGAIALDPVDGSGWVCDAQLDALRHFQDDGSSASPFELSGISQPLDVATDPLDRSVWVCERGGNRVRRFLVSGTAAGSVDLAAPSRVDVDSVTHAAWVTSFTTGKVFVISNTPATRDSSTAASGPIGIAVDPRRGRIWVADAAGNAVVALRRDASLEFRVAGLGEPREVAVDPQSGNAWVTLLAHGEVAVISPTGVVLQHTGGFSQPYGISIGVFP
ncbi:MAG TPA: hypothetical protein VL123_01240 [Candidatus Udaeobacter sp.]|jgi:DNA-binding beta-propeller fold protein YncE|nr:hypothetical protein [Candidatus Udaeobacter sp.]